MMEIAQMVARRFIKPTSTASDDEVRRLYPAAAKTSLR
jgi:hypothetical protein